MWEIQVALQVAIVCTGLYLEATGVTGEWKCGCSGTPCGAFTHERSNSGP